MTSIILSGCLGAMGRKVSELARERDDCVIAAGIDIAVPEHPESIGYPVFTSFDKCGVEADVIVDFSHNSLIGPLLDYAKARNIPAVLCTTGYSAEQLALIDEASKTLPLFRSGNMSLGINLLISLAKKAASVLGTTFDIEITERHHNQKLDAPSGTALMIADAVSETLGTSPSYEYDRHSRRMKRPHNEIGLHSVRGGTIVGEHEVLFAGPSEELIITHRSESKGILAAGALSAAVFMRGKPAGSYDMDSLLNSGASSGAQ